MERGSISSESSSTEFACTKTSLAKKQQPWDTAEVTKALSSLPAGETALTLIPTLHGDILEKTLEVLKCISSDKTKDQTFVISNFANGYVIQLISYHKTKAFKVIIR